VFFWSQLTVGYVDHLYIFKEKLFVSML